MASSAFAFHDNEQHKILPRLFSAQDRTTSNTDVTSIQTAPLLSGPFFDDTTEPNIPVALRKVLSGIPSETKMLPLRHKESSPERNPAFSPSDHSLYPVQVPFDSLPDPNRPVSVTKSFQVYHSNQTTSSALIPDSLLIPKPASSTSVGSLPASHIKYGSQVSSDCTEPVLPPKDADEVSMDGRVSVQQMSVKSDETPTVNGSLSRSSSTNFLVSSQHMRSPSFTSTPFLFSIPKMPEHIKPVSGTYSTTISEKSFVSANPAVFRQETASSETPVCSVSSHGENALEPWRHRGVAQQHSHENKVKTSGPHPEVPVGKFPGKPVRSLKTETSSTSQSQQPSNISHPSHVFRSNSGSGSSLSSAHSVQAEDDITRLKQQVRELSQAKANLEGQLESVVSECQSTLQERSLLYSKLAKTQVELHALQDSPHEQANQKQDGSAVHDNTSLQDEISKLETSLGEKKRELALLHKQFEKERDRIGKLGNELVESKRDCANKAREINEFQDVAKSLKHSCKEKADEVDQLTQNVATTEACLKSAESSKLWLHGQLREAVQAKLQLQEEVRTARATSIAQSVQLDQLQKESSLYQEQIDGLRKSIFKDKAKLVSELEVIEADVALKEDTFAKVQAEKVHVEQMLSLKMHEAEKLGHEVAQQKARNAELEWKLSEVESHGDVLLPQLQAAEQEKEMLAFSLQQQKGMLNDMNKELDQLRKTKRAQQENIRQLETALVDKEGIVQELKDSSQLSQHELKAIKQAKESVDDELVQAAATVALAETKLSGAQAEMKTARFEIDRIREQLKEKENTLQDLLEQLGSKEEELSKRGVALSSLETQSQETKSQFESLQHKFESMIDESERSIDEKERVVRHLAAELDKARSELEDLTADNGKMKYQIEKLLEENARQVGQLESIASDNPLQDFQKVLDEKAAMESEFRSLRVGHQHDMFKSQGRILQLEAELKDSRRKAYQEARQLEKDLEQSQNQLQELQETLSAAEDALQKVRE